MASAPRMAAKDVKDRMGAGADLILVCAYDDDQKCNQLRLPGSVSLNQLRAREQGLSQAQEIVFY